MPPLHDVGSAQEDERHSRQQPAGHPERNQATAHLNSVSAKIDSGQGTVGALVNDKQLYNNLEQTTATLQATMVQAQAGVTDFQENMEALKHNFLLSGYFKKRGYEDSTTWQRIEIDGLPQATPAEDVHLHGQAALR